MIWDDVVDELGFDPASVPETCIVCEKPHAGLDHQYICERCVENARFDAG